LAVNVAADGNTVWVSNGVYVLTNQVVIDKAITLKSLNGRAATSINGNYPWTTNRCLYVSNAYATVDGFSISNGWANTNVYPNNGYGGGVYLKNGTVINCLVSSNYAAWRGGGVFCQGNNQNTVSNCVIEYNKAEWGGGGICDAGGATPRVSIVNCNISRNIGGASECGGGIRQYGGSTNLTIRNCVISYNRVANATGPTYGGAGIILAQTGFVENCTIVGNTLTGSGNAGGGGIFVRYGVAYIKNCIIYSNSAEVGQANWGTNAEGTVFSNNCTDTTNNMVGSGNITANPVFVDWATTNLRLSGSSPCVNKGINQDWMNGAIDFDGKPRIRYGAVDMGAYETIYGGTIYQFH